MFYIVHNPRCSKSRQTLEILESRHVEVKVIEYLKGELEEKTLRQILNALSLRPKDILRTKEDDFKKLSLDLEDDEGVIKAMMKFPQIIERPLVLHNEQAVIGRPPENVFGLLA